jgi:hypothetical protein
LYLAPQAPVRSDDIPLDVQAKLDPERLQGLPPVSSLRGDEQQLKRQVAEAIQLFNRAERPRITW